ncbi:cytochrome-c peroxidase [Spirosoma daeguense]
MRRLAVLFLGVLTLLGFLPEQPRPNTNGQAVYKQFMADKVRFHQQVQQLASFVRTNASQDSLQMAFRRSRLSYKRIEWLLEYYQPYLASHVNGPPVAEIEIYEMGQQAIPPTGLQVIEPLLFPEFQSTDTAKTAELNRELTTLLSYSARLEQGIPPIPLTDSDIVEATRQQLFRLLSLGITGYDTPEVRSALPEAAISLRTLQAALRPYEQQLPKPTVTYLEKRWKSAIQAVDNEPDFDTFDRVMFIREQLYPLCRALQQMRQEAGIAEPSSGRFLSPQVATLSDSGAFRPDYVTNFRAFASTPQKVALGQKLFFDPLLSGNNKRSCASCHRPERAFTDGRSKSRAFGNPFKRVNRNAPTLLNAGLQKAQFYDSRVVYLEDQAHDVLKNAHEMRTSPEDVVTKLGASAQYKKLFVDAFPNGLNPTNVRNALACYVRSLSSLNARPDQYLRGEAVTLSADERLGFNLFLGKARCATCHFFPIYNGYVPPHFEKVESEIIGVPNRPKISRAKIDPDLGKFGPFQKDLHRFAFKTPTVRNAALTAPYMHNGAYKTLEQVVDFYNRGGGRGIGIDVEGQTLADKPLDLTPHEQRALVAFMQALTDTTGLTKRPYQLPAVEGHPAWNRRKSGGRY